MNKLLLLAVLGLVVGGGLWKFQNPDASLNDLKTQAMGSVERLQSGVSAVIEHPEKQAEEISMGSRLSALEQQLEQDDTENRTEEIKTLLDEKLAENANSLTSLQETLNNSVVPMEDMTAAVAQLDTALQDTRARTDAGNVRIDAIDRRLELLVRRLDEQSSDGDMQALQETVGGIQSEVEKLQLGFDDNQTRFDERLTDIAEQSGSLGLRLNTLASSASASNGAQADGDNADNAEGNTASLQALSSSIDTRLGAIEERLSTVNSDSRRIASLSEQLTQANSKIAELEEQDVQASQSLEELGSSVAELTTVGESLSIDSIQAQIQDQLALAQSQFDSKATSTNTEQLESLLETTRNRIQTLEQRVQSLPASSSEADDALETQNALQAQIAELGQRLESMTSSDPALVNKVNDVKQQVERLSAEGFVTQDELRATQEAESIEYKIYFDRNSAEVTDDAARVLKSFIAQEKNRTTGVSIFGFTDRSGSAAYNQQLALQRATNVRSYLIQNGLDFTKVKALSGLGEDAAAAVLPDNAADAQQRVVVLYAAQP